MPKLVTIINANGRRGKVAATYPPLVQGLLEVAPDQDEDAPEVVVFHRDPEEPVTVEVPVNLAAARALDGEVEAPAKNASTETWRDYALSRPDSGLSSDEVEAMSRDELVAHFTTEENQS